MENSGKKLNVRHLFKIKFGGSIPYEVANINTIFEGEGGIPMNQNNMSTRMKEAGRKRFKSRALRTLYKETDLKQ
ncbi:hypothetical protein VIGAN_04063800 [Vigna angularis var. angularis]|uniref:Uncharacterized protein n=1 Tax=Vigna angularis var. angularis TaxID=157739 RepID=A0A0S3RSD6_PHAAN|nr:hypothetical protein VIGAN_04063800 [Vigna angularis var. angularis]